MKERKKTTEEEIKSWFYTCDCSEGIAGAHGALAEESYWRNHSVVKHTVAIPESQKSDKEIER